MLYTIYSSFILFYVPFYTLDDINGSDGLNNYIGSQALATTLIIIFTNYSIVFIHYRATNPGSIFMLIIGLIMFSADLAISNASGTWTAGNLKDIMTGSPLTILTVAVGTVMNFLPIYIIRRYEEVIKAPEFYQGPKMPK